MNATERIALWATPGRHFGDVCIMGTRVSSRLLAQSVWGSKGNPEEDVAEIAAGVELTRAHVLLSCWFEAAHGHGVIRKAWEPWADEHAMLMWRDKWDEVPVPPSRVRIKAREQRLAGTQSESGET